LVGNRVGGINVFGGGLVLLAKGGIRVGGVGVSGDTSCTDHIVAWQLRRKLNLDHLGPTGSAVGGVAAVFNNAHTPRQYHLRHHSTDNGGLLNPGGTLSKSASGFGHPTCLFNPDPFTLPPVQNP
jgi:hypothetical protein